MKQLGMFVWFFQVEFPKVEPQFKPPFLGFTRTAEIWNSRACMIGIIGVFVVEFVSVHLLTAMYIPHGFNDFELIKVIFYTYFLTIFALSIGIDDEFGY